MSSDRVYRLIRRSAVVGACVAAMPAWAAESVSPGAAGLEEVIVTATKRETNLQDTPIAVTAFSQTALEQAHVNDLAGLQSYVPNLTVEQHGDSGGRARLSARRRFRESH